MSRTQVLQDIRKMKFEELYDRRQSGRLTQSEAAQVLGISERTFRRYEKRFEQSGAEGLYDARLGKQASNRVPTDKLMAMLELFDTQYYDYSPKHFHEKLVSNHGYSQSYNWVRLALQSHNRIQKGGSSGKHRRKRERKPLPGMMLHQDASTHEWVPGQSWDLIVTMDDATSEIYSAFFVLEEGTTSSFQGVREAIETKGLFCSLYTDRGAHYWHTPQAGGKVDKTNPTQFGRAMAQLNIEMIPAYSPEARGRSERMFGTLQGRLPQELRSEGITTIDEANRYLAQTFLPDHNARFAKTASDKGCAFTVFVGGLDDILCIQEQRVVGNDNTVRYKGLSLQLAACEHRYHFVKAKVRVHEYSDGQLAVFHGPRCIGLYCKQGKALEKGETETQMQAA